MVRVYFFVVVVEKGSENLGGFNKFKADFFIVVWMEGGVVNWNVKGLVFLLPSPSPRPNSQGCKFGGTAMLINPYPNNSTRNFF